MNDQEIKILGEKKIPKLLLKFSIPCVMGLLIGALYNIVDQIFIGNSELGYLGNAATGVSFPIICIANAFAWCIGDGAASYLSICSGRQDADRAHKCVGTGLVKMTTVFFQSIGKSVHAVVTSLVRDILCFTPLAVFLSAGLERQEAGAGINGILLAAPIADAVAAVVIAALTVSFFRKMSQSHTPS